MEEAEAGHSNPDPEFSGNVCLRWRCGVRGNCTSGGVDLVTLGLGGVSPPAETKGQASPSKMGLRQHNSHLKLEVNEVFAFTQPPRFFFNIPIPKAEVRDGPDRSVLIPPTGNVMI